MARLAVQRITLSGVEPAFEYVSPEGDEFPNDGNTWVELANGSISNSYTVRFVAQGSVQGVDFEDVTVTMGVGARKKVGPFPKMAFNDAEHRVQMTYAGNGPEQALLVGVFGV